MQLLTLLLLSQYVLDPEPIMQLEAQSEFNTYPKYDYDHDTIGMLGVPDPNTGEVSSEYWFVPQSMGYLVEYRDEGAFQSALDQFQTTPPLPLQPVLAIEDKGHLYFVMNQAQLRYFLVRWLGCKACWPERPIDSAFRARLNPALAAARQRGWIGAGDTYDVRIEKIDLWPSASLTWAALQGMGSAEFRSTTIYLQPWMLRYVRIYIAPELLGNSEELVPAWVQVRLGHNQVWINRAEARLGDLTWAEFYAKHGFIPGDRTVLDMQYTFQLRRTLDFSEYKRRITYGTRCEPEVGPRGFGVGGRYTACAEALWTEERDAAAREVVEMNEVCDVYAGDK